MKQSRWGGHSKKNVKLSQTRAREDPTGARARKNCTAVSGGAAPDWSAPTGLERRGWWRKLRACHARRLRWVAVLARRSSRTQVGSHCQPQSGRRFEPSPEQGRRRAPLTPGPGRPPTLLPTGFIGRPGRPPGPSPSSRVCYPSAHAWRSRAQGSQARAHASVSSARLFAILKVLREVLAQEAGDLAEPSRTAPLRSGPAVPPGTRQVFGQSPEVAERWWKECAD